MGVDHPLDAVIRRATSRHKADRRSDSEVLVAVDCKKKEAFDKRPMPWHDVKYFLVRNTLDNQDPAECEPRALIVKDIAHDREVIIKLKCWASCSPGNEKRLAVALCDPTEGPWNAFEKLIRRWLDDFITGKGGSAKFIDGYFAEPQDDESKNMRESLQDYLQTHALAKAGLNLQVKAWLAGEGGIHKAVEVSTDGFLVSVNDYRERQELEVNCELELDEQHKINAVIHHRETAQLKNKVIDVTKKYFASEVSLDQFYGGLSAPALLGGLRSRLDKALAAEGRRVGRIFLKGAAPEEDKAPPQFGPYNVPVSVSIQEYPDEIVIGNKLLLSRRVVSLYRDKSSPPLDRWAKEKLGQIIRDVLFNAKYIDLLLDFDERKVAIEARLRAEAALIGYEVKQLITVPNLAPLKWLEPFPIKVETDFETLRPRTYVRLSIIVTARFDTLEEPKIRGPLNRRENVPLLMEKDVRNVASQYLHGIEPEQFYTCFAFPDEKQYPGKSSVQAALRDGITNMLVGKYGAEVIEVIPRMDDTDVILNLMVLQERPCDFNVSATPRDGGASVSFKGKFCVEGVDPGSWHTFLSRKFTIEDVRQHLEDDVRAKLKTKTREELLYRRLEDLKEMEATIHDIAAVSIKNMFGLLIEVSAVDRDRTIVEKNMSDEFTERELAAIRRTAQRRIAGEEADEHDTTQRKEVIKQLADERRRLGPDAPAEQLQELDDMIRQEREKLMPDGISPLEDVERLLRPELPAAAQADARQPAKLTEGAAEPVGGGYGHGEERP